MKSLSCLLVGILCMASPCHASDKHTTSSFPQDVKAFKGRRDACDYFRSEGASLHKDKERAKQVVARMQGYCAGTDKELVSLKTKYKDDKAVSKELAGYAEKTE